MSKWTKKWPKKAGKYWFYGQSHADLDSDVELFFVEVHKISNGFAYVTKGHFIYESEAKGLWQKAITPELPKE